MSGWQSMGEGRELEPTGNCNASPDDKHHYRATECIQSVETFVCEYCGDTFYD